MSVDGKIIKGADNMRLILLRKGKEGIRGVPDGSGPEGKGPTGRKKGGCPKREDFDNEFDYYKALRKWQAENGKGPIAGKKSMIMTAIELKKAKYTRKYRGPRGNWIYKYDDGRKRRLKQKKEDQELKAPEFTGDWDDKKRLMEYMRNFRGDSFKAENRKFRVGEETYLEGDPNVGISGAHVRIVAPTGKGYVMVYDIDDKEFDEVRADDIA
jgi:hypothetical protein